MSKVKERSIYFECETCEKTMFQNSTMKYNYCNQQQEINNINGTKIEKDYQQINEEY